MISLSQVSARRHRGLPPRFEALESRTLLSLSPYLVADVNTLGASSSPQGFTTVGSKTFFLADDGVHGQELWKTNGSGDGTSLVKDINPGPASSSISGMTAFKGLLLFFADDGTHGRELWESDGTAAGTHLVMDINPGGADAFPASRQVITNVNGSLYFAANDGSHGVEPWVIPASQLGASMVRVRGASIAEPGPINSAAPAPTAPSPIISSLGAHSDLEGQVLGAVSTTNTLPVQSPRIVRVRVQSVVPIGSLGSSRRGFGPKVSPDQLFDDGSIIHGGPILFV